MKLPHAHSAMKLPHTHSILIVDDDEDDREFIREAFLTNNHHHEYVFINDGEHLMEYLQTSQSNRATPTLILLDLNMPRKDGRAALKEIKESRQFHHISVIVLTTSSSEEDRTTSYDLGANCFLTKPRSFQDLVDIARSIHTLWLSVL